MYIFKYDHEDIELLLQQLFQSEEVSPYMFLEKYNVVIKDTYFTGATLCIDVIDGDDIDVITISHSSESIGVFTGGYRRLLTIKSLKYLEQIMLASHINFVPKWIKK